MKTTYKRMLKGMQDNEASSTPAPFEPWCLYVLECADGSYYTGIAKDLEKRFAAHNTGKGARYTRTRLPVRLVYQESCLNRSAALIRECAFKALPRAKKTQIILERGSL